MTGNVALDIFIGLVFLYLLYSLFAAIILEGISNLIGMRAFNLRRVIYNMLNDDREKVSFFRWLWWCLVSMIGKGNSQKGGGLARAIYSSPGVKYLGKKSLVNSAPTNISAKQFVKALLYVILEHSGDSNERRIENVRQFLEKGAGFSSKDGDPKETPNDPVSIYAVSTTGIKYLNFLFRDAQGDLDRFKEKVEEWYEEMMLVATEWYKKRTQIWLLLIGFALAVAFNLNTLYITKILALNNKAREQMVELAKGYLEGNSTDTIETSGLAEEEFAESYKDIRRQAEHAADVLSLPKETPEKVLVKDIIRSDEQFLLQREKINSFLKIESDYYLIFEQPDELAYLNVGSYVDVGETGATIKVGDAVAFNGTRYFWSYQLWGFLITAIALSLGAPFWFDLLNKLMQLRGAISQKKPAESEGQNKRAVAAGNIKG